MNLNCYLNFLNEQAFGVAPQMPVQNPQQGRPTSVKRLQPKIPVVKKPPVNPQQKKLDSVPQKDNKITKKSYFNYMMWTTKIVKQGEIFRKNCYDSNCDQYEIGTGDRRLCKDRCDIEECKKVIALLRASMGKCVKAENPNLCKVRYAQLIPLYQKMLLKISKNFVAAAKVQKQTEPKVG